MDIEQLRFFNPHADIRRTENRLPHWQQNGTVYFLTFRLADALPKNLRDEWKAEREVWLRYHPAPWNADAEKQYHHRFSGAVERWLDAGHGSCVLRRPDCANIVANALRHFDGERYVQLSWVIMPNHVHCVLIQNNDWPLEKVLHSWKRFTARSINQLIGRDGTLWQTDYFDRLVRDENHFANCVRYIRNNPPKARLQPDQCLSYGSEIVRSIE
ncbi:MAG TPA: transposase [Chthoniobacterales bacterium]